MGCKSGYWVTSPSNRVVLWLVSVLSSASFSSPSLGVILARVLLARERDTRVGVRILKEEDVYEGVESHNNRRRGGCRL